VSAAQQTPPVERRLRLIDGGGAEATDRTVRHAFAFRPRPSNAALALTDDDPAPPAALRPRLRLVGDPADRQSDPFEVPADGAPLGVSRDPVWLEEFLERAAAVLRERPRTLRHAEARAVPDELARIRHLRPVRSSTGEADERGVHDRCDVVRLHGRPRPRATGRARC
jgi:hypothetical protein